LFFLHLLFRDLSCRHGFLSHQLTVNSIPPWQMELGGKCDSAKTLFLRVPWSAQWKRGIGLWVWTSLHEATVVSPAPKTETERDREIERSIFVLTLLVMDLLRHAVLISIWQLSLRGDYTNRMSNMQQNQQAKFSYMISFIWNYSSAFKELWQLSFLVTIKATII
jgi:hypothetical protein